MTYFEGPFHALAHRGFAHESAGTEGLENSLAAFGAAVDLGYRYVETDAHGTADGVAVALHDESLDRTTDGTGLVADLPWSDVSEARIGGVEPVPLLEDVLGGWPDLCVNIDVKHTSGVGPVARAIEKTSSWDRVCVTSFDAARRRATLARLSRPVATSAGRNEIRAFLTGVRLHTRPLVRRSLRDVDALQGYLEGQGVRIVDPADEYYEDYYAVFFLDPDGLKLEGMKYGELTAKRKRQRKSSKKKG